MKYPEFNPNHKYRFYLFQGENSRWLMDLRVAGGDDSLYLMPLLSDSFSVLLPGEAESRSFSGTPGEDLHFSFHESGVINLTAGRAKARLKHAVTDQASSGHVVTLGIQSGERFRPASEEDFNSLGSKYTPIVVTGFLQHGPVYMSLFRSAASGDWVMPSLSDTFQLHVGARIRGRDTTVHFVIWQHEDGPRCPADVALFWSP